MEPRSSRPDSLTPAEHKAYALSQAAIALDRAREARRGEEDPVSLVEALNHNLELWVGIQSMVKAANGALPDEVRSNLSKLGDFVIGTTFRHGHAIADQALDTLININLQISEGLLESQAG
ncbi:MAG: flagellar biosynthesis regulator FlaF [Rhodospirillales bacterium]